MALLPSLIPTPAGVVRAVVGTGLGAARSLTARLPGLPGGTVAPQHIGTDPKRRHPSKASRSLAR